MSILTILLIFFGSFFTTRAAPMPIESKTTAGEQIDPGKFTYEATTVPAQIPLCMIGDSITWAGDGDYWRKYLIEHIPSLAFVGTHTAILGYSHAGEGGNGTEAVLNRMKDIPDCPYYSLLIGVNNNNITNEAVLQQRAEYTAGKIQEIVFELLKKPGVKKIFLGSIFPCQTDNPLRDKTSSATNAILRKKMNTVFPKDKVIWVEYEEPIRAIANWGPLIQLHPTKEGYKIPAKILAEKLIEIFKISNPSAGPVPKANTGVRVVNLWDQNKNSTIVPIIAGWYTISFDLIDVTGNNPLISISSSDPAVKFPLKQIFKINPTDKGKRVTLNMSTAYEGYGYSRSKLKITATDCGIDKILYEKRRPSGNASSYGKGSYLDTKTTFVPGELVESVEKSVLSKSRSSPEISQ